jgi:23S rRNA pseudouridine1911/1915/1917 synthase
LEPEQILLIHVPEARELNLTPDSGPLEILFEDEHLAFINKPRGLSVHPSETDLGVTVVHRLMFHLKTLSTVGGVLRPGIVHRLDKNTSGVLVVSKSDAVHLALARLFETHDLDRRYWAWCYGTASRINSKSPLKLETRIARNPQDRLKMSCDIEGGRTAISEFLKLKNYSTAQHSPFASWIEAKLYTGRTHQVRVHLNHLGSSILGDTLYGVPTATQPKLKTIPQPVRQVMELLQGQALHARVLGLRHPVTGENLRFEANLPEVLTHLTQALEPYQIDP